MRTLLMILAFALVPSLARADKAAPLGPASTAVKTANDKIDGLLKQKVAPNSPEEKKLSGQVTESLRGFLDIDELGKRAMVDQWSKLTAAQQTEFLTTLRELIEDNYIKGLRSNLSYTVAYPGESTDKDGNTVVTTQINTKRKNRTVKIEVDYVLKKQGDKLKAWDVKTDGVGLVENYRAQFNKIIAKDGVDGLITKMKKKRTQGS